MINNPLENAKHLGKFLNTNLSVPKDIEIYYAEPGDKFFSLKEHKLIAKKVKRIDVDGSIVEIGQQGDDFCIPFAGLNSKLFYVDSGANEEELEEKSIKIKENMNEREMDLILKAKKKFKNEKLIFVRRKISLEIAKLMKIFGNNPQRAIIIAPTPIEKEGEKNGKVYLGAYGYESIIVAVIEK